MASEISSDNGGYDEFLAYLGLGTSASKETDASPTQVEEGARASVQFQGCDDTIETTPQGDPSLRSSDSDFTEGNSELSGAIFSDHFTLRSSSSTVKFRSGNVHIHNQAGSQFVLEERTAIRGIDGSSQPKITVKRSENTSHGEFFVRLWYSAIAIFLGACFYIFSIGLVLFLFSDLAVQIQYPSFANVFPLLGTFFAVPILVDGLVYLLSLTTGFVVDVFNGHPLLNLFGWGSVAASWAAFLAFSGIPVLAFIGCLMAQSQNAVEITLITCFISVLVFFLFFARYACVLQVKSGLELIQNVQARARGNMSLFNKVKAAIWICTSSRLSGKKQQLHVIDCDDFDLKDFSSRNPSQTHRTVYMTRGRLWLQFTQLPIMRFFFKKLEHPQRRWTEAEISGSVPFYTKYSWGLEQIYCRNRNRSAVVVVGGPAAVSGKQGMSSSIFFFLATGIIILLVASVLVWFHISALWIVVAVVLLIVYWFGKLQRGAKLAKEVNQRINDWSEANEQGKGHAMLQKWECYTMTRPRKSFIIAFLLFHFLFCFLLPFVYLCSTKNIAGIITFSVMGLMHFQQRSLDMVQILEEIGSFAFSNKRISLVNRIIVTDNREQWKFKARLHHINSLNSYHTFWSRVLGAMVWLFIIVCILAVFGSRNEVTMDMLKNSSQKLDPWMNFPTNDTFFYQQPQVKVNSACRLDTADQASSMQYLTDYGFLANLPYFKTETIQPLLDSWFGIGKAVYHADAQIEFRELHPEYMASEVSYELVSFPGDSTAAVLIRGTKTAFDYFADAKLWYSSALFQAFREAIPFGMFFTPLLRFNIGFLSFIERSSMNKYAYYVETSAFIESIKDSGEYSHIFITGHSLGGGVALISGAQTHTNAVGLSAPNTVLGRSTVRPRLQLDDLRKYTFNIVPERDIFPKIGDQLSVEKIKCRAEYKDSFGCHDAGRSVCEMLYSCGNVARPVYCECVTKYGYDEPVAVFNDTKSFEAVCTNKD